MQHFYHNIKGWSRDEYQGELLRFIMSKYNKDSKLSICEVGVYEGRCTAMWNVQLINEGFQYDYYAIDNFEGSSEHKRDNQIPIYETAQSNLLPIINKINLIKSNSTSAANKFKDETLDIVYIDASHEYEFVKEDILTWLPKIKNGGFLCGDDYHEAWQGVVKAVDEIFQNKKTIIGGTQWLVIK